MSWVQKRIGQGGSVTYTATYRDPAGRGRSAGTFTSRREAERAGRRAESKVEDGSWLVVMEGDVLPEPNSRNGLVRACPEGANISSGIQTGKVLVSVDARAQAPSEVELRAWDLDGWDEVVEVGLRSRLGRMTVASLMSDVAAELLVTVAGPGSYRLRVHARGRDTAPDGLAEDPVESYHLVSWPAADPHAGDIVLKVSDRVGRQRRTTAAIEASHARTSRIRADGLNAVDATELDTQTRSQPVQLPGPGAQTPEDAAAYDNLRRYQGGSTDPSHRRSEADRSGYHGPADGDSVSDMLDAQLAWFERYRDLPLADAQALAAAEGRPVRVITPQTAAIHADLRPHRLNIWLDATGA